MATYYDRYKKFKINGTIELVPFIKIPKRDSDTTEVYEYGKSRLDLISYKYYNDPNYGWLILQANPEVGGMEFLIPNGYTLRIPLPLPTVLMQYENDIDRYNKLYR